MNARKSKLLTGREEWHMGSCMSMRDRNLMGAFASILISNRLRNTGRSILHCLAMQASQLQHAELTGSSKLLYKLCKKKHVFEHVHKELHKQHAKLGSDTNSGLLTYYDLT